MFISKSFKDRFFKTAFFRKADAKVRTIFELTKLFGKYFSESFYRQRFITLIPGHHVNAHPLSLSKAGAKLLLYNIQAKLYRTLFSSFLGTFLQEADSQTDYGLRKEVANRQEECRYTLYHYARAYKEKKRKELPYLQQARKHLGNMGITVADQGNRNATSATATGGQTWQENTGVADHLQQEKNEGQ